MKEFDVQYDEKCRHVDYYFVLVKMQQDLKLAFKGKKKIWSLPRNWFNF